jgi:hypothetical protein
VKLGRRVDVERPAVRFAKLRGRSCVVDNRESSMSKTHPLTARHLENAHDNRDMRLTQFTRHDGSARLAGCEEPLEHLDEIESAVRESEPLRPLTLLMQRVRADYEIALEAALLATTSLPTTRCVT